MSREGGLVSSAQGRQPYNRDLRARKKASVVVGMGSEMFRPEDEYPNFPVLPRQLFRAKSLDETFACTYAERDPRHLAIVGNTAVTVMFGPRKF